MEVRDVIPLFAICFDLVLAPRMMRKGDDVMAVTFSFVGSARRRRDGQGAEGSLGLCYAPSPLIFSEIPDESLRSGSRHYNILKIPRSRQQG